MARNEEKRQSMLNRYLQQKTLERDKSKGIPVKRPYLVSECRSLVEAEKWRGDVLKEIGRRVSEIQNELLPEPRIRELNDEINRLLRLKHVWERRILELGGPCYFASRKTGGADDEDGISVVPRGSGDGGGPVYKYFGAARKLPGVKDLFYDAAAAKTTNAKKQTRAELYKRVDVDYYGWRDDEDGELATLEAEAEKREITKAQEEAHMRKKQKVEAILQHDMNAYEVEWDSRGDGEEGESEGEATTGTELDSIGQAVIPSKEEVEKAIVQKRKEELLKRYVSSSLQSSLQNSKSTLFGGGKNSSTNKT